MPSLKHQGVFSEVYDFDQSSGSYIVEIALDHYSDIFNEWDPAPFKLRDLDPDLIFYLEESSDDIPFRYPLTLCFSIPEGKREEQREKQVKRGLHNGFTYERYLAKKELKNTNQRIFLFILAGFLFLLAATTYPQELEIGIFPTIIVEGLYVGGWVFLWEAISMLVFTTRDLYHKFRTYKRLQNSTVIFKEVVYEDL
ncbi:hypothetical protein QA601_02170 [Chitinispirillales bacterium ANBcel5]|uniref:hypothetical protein n=1 Tax=Cellulosispirillum alkaliphilum TaxID=3039283 RepID=UPI002A567CC0|nr:hypothetical protein [Chitinispirillales bacterium ANBcel5]